jgi:hypothetical protein
MAFPSLPRTIALLLLSSLPVLCQINITFPALTGPYKVGTVALEFVSPSTSLDSMASIFYPAHPSCANYPLAPAYPEATIPLLLESAGLPSNAFTLTVTTQSHLSAPILSTSFPVLFFSTGYGTSRLVYTSTCEDLASLGYIVILIDHPIDTPFIEYPDGQFFIGNPHEVLNFTYYIPIVAARVQDIISVYDALSNATFISQIPGVIPHLKEVRGENGFSYSPFQIGRVGVLGHSLGGATALSTMEANKHFVAGFNIDGAIIANATTVGTSEPYVIMASSGHNQTTIPTWGELWPNLRGYKREFSVANTIHTSFWDYLVLADDLIALGVLPESITEMVGIISGTRLLELESAYIGGFFDKWFKGGTATLLNGPSPEYPEVTFQDF